MAMHVLSLQWCSFEDDSDAPLLLESSVAGSDTITAQGNSGLPTLLQFRYCVQPERTR